MILREIQTVQRFFILSSKLKLKMKSFLGSLSCKVNFISRIWYAVIQPKLNKKPIIFEFLFIIFGMEFELQMKTETYFIGILVILILQYVPKFSLDL